MAVPFVLLLIASSFLQIWASDPLYYESFDEPFEGRWIVSKKEDYEGLWRHSKSDGHEDYGLLVSEKGRKHAIVKELDEPIILKDGTVILQFEVRLQNGLECGGAYLKYLRPQKAGWTAREFDNESPYTIMFGPDKCGGTDKVHFIFPHKNPKTGQFVEHHLKYAPTIPYDKLSHVYTAILKPDNELRILIDGEERRKANFLSSDDFEPAFIPPKTIPDPDDKKPEDWDERTKIPDPDAVKPDDWDEDAPEEIEDEEAVKPEGWLDDEPEEIDDPGSIKPKDWDDEEDGEWEAIKIDNPNCEAAPGCGEWKRPMKRNPAYKGKWHAPLIDNTNYKGIWKPREIDNPDYFELDKPDFEPIIAIGIEILTMQDGILFDNILISRDEKVAESYRAETWKPKYEVEKEKEKAEDGAAGFSDMLSGFQKKVFDVLYKIADIPFLEAYKNKIIDAIEMGEKQPNLTIGILVSIVVVIVTVISRVLFGGEKPKAPAAPISETEIARAGKTEVPESNKEEKETDKEDESAPRPRRSRRETSESVADLLLTVATGMRLALSSPPKHGRKRERDLFPWVHLLRRIISSLICIVPNRDLALGFLRDPLFPFTMGGRKMAAPLLLLLIASSLLQIWASDPLFYESFDEPFEARWIVSEKEDYTGLWKHSKSDGHEDYGLLVSEKARKYAIVKELDEPIILKDGTVVLQFEVRLQNGLECGGAYLKYLRPQEAGWTSKGFDNDSPYSIMFGPDKCGSTNKVHFILQHKNPKTGKFVEHHVKYPPSVPSDKLSHVYTAILKPDNELRILIDGEEKKKANFFSSDDFEPALIPPKTIPDPDDKKPEDWDERAKIPDPDAVKPDDWDEDAPMEIEDEEAVKPEGWLDDEPEEIDDPEATKPEDWDDEEDGEWEAPKIDNPKCEAAPGCGEWKMPMKRNPAYKGKWHAPLIDNPNYKGIWKPQQIDNPDYFELDKPDFEPITAIGIEIWTMQDGILFDNILIASDEKVAESYRMETWKPKYEVEKEKQKAEDASVSSDGLSGFQKKVFDVLYKFADIPFLESHKIKIIDVIEKAEKQPNLTIGILASILVVILTVIFRILFGGKKPQAPVAPTTETNNSGAAETEATGGSEEKEENEKDDASAPRPRRSRRET
ncbi:unnamed protein product [Musa acuminata var. zebrina]